MAGFCVVFAWCEEAEAKYGYLNFPSLAQWEELFLGAEGDISFAGEQLLLGRDMFRDCEAAKAKYEHLIPTELEKWEFKWLKNGGPRAWIERRVYRDRDEDGVDPFLDCEDARAKYGHLTSPSIDQWEKEYLGADGGTTWIERQLLYERDVFSKCDDARVKYERTIPTELEQ